MPINGFFGTFTRICENIVKNFQKIIQSQFQTITNFQKI